MPVRSPKPIVRLILDGTAVRVWLDRIHRVDPGVRPRFASVYFFLPPAHRGGRVIDTDALRILLLSREPSDGQERNQDNEDNPNINAHQSSPLMGKSTIDTIHEVRLKQFCARLREGLSRPESTSFAILPGCRLKLGNLFQSDGEQFGGLVACAAGLEWSRLPACVFVRLRPLTKSPSSRERQKRLG